MVVSDVKYCSKTMLLLLVNNKSLYFIMVYQLLTVIIVKYNDRGKYNVSLELTLTTLANIISLMAASVLAIQRNHRCMDTDGRGYKGSIH